MSRIMYLPLYFHSFVLFYEENEEGDVVTILAGQPTNSPTIKSPWNLPSFDYGPILVEEKVGVPKDFEDFDRVVVSEGLLTCSALRCFEAEKDRINAANIDYAPRGPNSNSVAWSMLTNCGITPKTPRDLDEAGLTPGWGIAI